MQRIRAGGVPCGLHPRKKDTGKSHLLRKCTAHPAGAGIDVDIDEDLYRREVIDTRLYGYLKIPLERGYTQNRKAGTPLSEAASIDSIAHESSRITSGVICWLPRPKRNP